MMLVVYVSSVVRSVLALHALINNKVSLILELYALNPKPPQTLILKLPNPNTQTTNFKPSSPKPQIRNFKLRAHTLPRLL